MHPRTYHPHAQPTDAPPSPWTPQQAATAALLDWPLLEAHLLPLFLTPYGRHAWETRPSVLPLEVAQQAQWQAAAFRELIERLGLPILSLELSVSALPALQKLGKEGVLSLVELTDLFQSLWVGRQLLSHARKGLQQLAPTSSLPKAEWGWLFEAEDASEAIAYLQTILTLSGEIVPTASPLLAELHETLKHQEQHRKELLQRMLNTPSIVSCLQEPIVMYRNGRPVLPVNVYYKTSVPGHVHDASSTGATLFVEPKAVAEQGNRIANTERAMDAELHRILKEASATLAVEAATLHRTLALVGQVDKAYMAGQLAKKLDAAPLRLYPAAPPLRLHLQHLRHPLLVLQESITVVPNDVSLGADAKAPSGDATPEGVRTLLITGPNTGGKTVLLKAVGLAMLMLQAGLLAPVGEGSYASLLTEVLADIGDAQNLQQSLSTFSGQIHRLGAWLAADASVRHQRLFLIDEIAAGTDPTEGAALAKVLIRALHAQQGFMLVSTHLGELKLEAHQQAGYQNASVLFDVQALAPTYRLHQGIPGASNALAIAQRLGLDAALIEEARTLMDASTASSAALLTELETHRVSSEQASEAILQQQAELEARLKSLKEEQQSFRESKKQQLQDFQAQLKGRLRSVEEQAKRIKKELKKAEQGESTVNPSLRVQQIHHLQQESDARLDALAAPLAAEMAAHTVEEQQPQQPWAIGMKVSSSKFQGFGEIEALNPNGKEATVRIGGMKSNLPLKLLVQEATAFSSAQAAKVGKRSERRSLLKKVSSPTAKPYTAPRYQSELDLRGQRVLEALEALERFLDNALVNNQDVVSIIHGHGTGAVKKAVKDYLKTHRSVRRHYSDGSLPGGDGCTVVELL